ncbi:hypothetical protein [Paenibacillus selenitireducens]|uniref:hypothetical protein n=1 Tax=Paenibacillus selenitireducens TaxID=1324314 RepID=UPI001301B5C2|nr:hypothetical protein [Paenibacillus selenitireducens]
MSDAPMGRHEPVYWCTTFMVVQDSWVTLRRMAMNLRTRCTAFIVMTHRYYRTV